MIPLFPTDCNVLCLFFRRGKRSSCAADGRKKPCPKRTELLCNKEGIDQKNSPGTSSVRSLVGKLQQGWM